MRFLSTIEIEVLRLLKEQMNNDFANNYHLSKEGFSKTYKINSGIEEEFAAVRKDDMLRTYYRDAEAHKLWVEVTLPEPILEGVVF
jgi:hypothetical protein